VQDENSKGVFRRRLPLILDAEPPTEPIVAMDVAMAEKVEHDQRVAEIFGRTGENRPRRPNGTEPDFGGGGVASRALEVNRSSLSHHSLG